MPLQGPQWKPREVLRLLWDNHWKDANILMTMGAVVNAESNNFAHAWHWNDPADGLDGSTDWGMFMENDGNKGGVSPDAQGNPQPGGIKTVEEITAFRDKMWDPYLAAPVARKQYVDRGFKPWAAYENKAYLHYIPTECTAMANMLAILNGLAPVV